jgi:hypothetical protein
LLVSTLFNGFTGLIMASLQATNEPVQTTIMSFAQGDPFMFTLGVGAFLGSTVGISQAASFASVSNTSAQTFTNQSGSSTNAQPLFAQSGNVNNAQPQGMQGMSGGQCGSLTVSSVNGSTIVAKSPNGSSVTIHTTASTKYTQSGKTVTASALKSGLQIQVTGTHNSDGSITATSIVIG